MTIDDGDGFKVGDIVRLPSSGGGGTFRIERLLDWYQSLGRTAVANPRQTFCAAEIEADLDLPAPDWTISLRGARLITDKEGSQHDYRSQSS